jgi:hypothetical protein
MVYGGTRELKFELCAFQKQNGSAQEEKPATTAAAVLGGAASTAKGKKTEPKDSIASMFAQSNKKTEPTAAAVKKEEAKEVRTLFLFTVKTANNNPAK